LSPRRPAGDPPGVHRDCRGRKAEGFARVLAITADDLEYLAEALLGGVRTTAVSRVRPAGEYGSHCEVIVPVRGFAIAPIESRTS